MARKPELIKLSGSESSSLTNILTRGSTAARTQTRARILDLLNRGKHPEEIAVTLNIGIATVFNIKRRYLTEGLESALYDKPRSGKPVSISGEAKAKITALACSDAPAGHARWTLRLLADKAVEAGFLDSISHNAVKEILKKTNSNRI
jgi:transposase